MAASALWSKENTEEFKEYLNDLECKPIYLEINKDKIIISCYSGNCDYKDKKTSHLRSVILQKLEILKSDLRYNYIELNLTNRQIIISDFVFDNKRYDYLTFEDQMCGIEDLNSKVTP